MASHGIKLTNSEIKDVIKVINSLENTGILLKEATKKLKNQKGKGFFSNALSCFTINEKFTYTIS